MEELLFRMVSYQSYCLLITGLILLTDFIKADPDPLPMFGTKTNEFIQVRNFSYKSCSPEGKLTLSNLNLKTDQGVLMLSGQASATAVLAPPIKVKVELKRSVFGFHPIIPCVNNKFGSCTFPDICKLVAKYESMCIEEMKLNNLSLPCSCPLQAGVYTLPEISIQMPNQFGEVAKGKYEALIVAEQNGEKLFCYDLNIQLDYS